METTERGYEEGCCKEDGEASDGEGRSSAGSLARIGGSGCRFITV